MESVADKQTCTATILSGKGGAFNEREATGHTKRYPCLPGGWKQATNEGIGQGPGLRPLAETWLKD